MRLIDANALLGKGIYSERAIETGGKDVVLLPLPDVMKSIANAPTIEAIPVEWIDWRIVHAEREGFVEVAEMLKTVRDWWNDQRDLWWEEKEREA